MTDALQPIRFGVFELDVRAGELRKSGVRIKLQDQPFQILQLLLERPGEIVTREEIQQKLWPDGTFVDFEHSLNAAVKRLRDALDDSADNPRFVETLPRRGYKFIAPVDGPVSEETPPTTTRQVPGGSARWVWWLAGASFALLLLAVGLNVSGLRTRLFGGVAPGDITSIAVLPLENLSGDSEQDYFADGMTQQLITELSKISALKVISRTSTMQYKGTKEPVPVIARELGVDAVIEGSVLRDGNQVRITAQLIHAPTDTNLWAESYDRELSDVLALFSEVAQTITEEIKVAITPEEESRLASTRSVNPEAYEAYLKGLYYWSRADHYLNGQQFFEEAIQKDPGFALAYVGLADSYAWSFGRFPLPPRQLYPKAKALAQKALELDDTLAEAHASLAFIKESYDWDWDSAQAGYLRAIQLNPNYSKAHAWYGLHLAIRGRFEDALTEIKLAEQLDPLSLLTKAQIGWIHFWAGDTDRAIEQFGKVVELDASFPLAHYNLGLGYTQKGMYEEAIAAYERTIALARQSVYLALLGHAYGKAGRKAEARKLLDELNERAKREYISGFMMAIFYLGQDNNELALASLEKAYQDRDPNLPNLKLEPFWFDPLQDDPRFQDLLRRMNFPPPEDAGKRRTKKWPKPAGRRWVAGAGRRNLTAERWQPTATW